MHNPSLPELQARFSQMKSAPALPLATRLRRLRALYDALENRADALVDALNRDFGRRAEAETRLADIALVLSDIRHSLKHLPQWTRPRPVSVGSKFWPSKAQLAPQPLGVVGVISPWNYPVNLALCPLTAAIAAGNRVMLKLSELTPHTNTIVRDIVQAVFLPEEVVVVEGDADTAAAFSRLPFGHLLFTGSTAVGRKVMQAAACQLTPVTLELGGKSPVLLDDDMAPEKVLPGIMAGKLFNAGQTCIAPDYLLAEPKQAERIRNIATTVSRQLYPQSLLENPDYTCIINQRHFQRLENLLRGLPENSLLWPLGRITEAHRQQRVFPPVLAFDPPADSTLMQEEIFGPILPVITCPGMEAKLDMVNARPHPLTLYLYSHRRATIATVRRHTLSGSLCVNETLVQFAQENLPFGGVGESGLGRYHGQAGFDSFSHLKPVYYQARMNANGIIRPPYTPLKKRLIRWLSRL